MARASNFALCLACALLVACSDFPRDAGDTLKQVQAGRPLRVGWSATGPWVRTVPGAQPTGVEPDILRRWAGTGGFRIEWVEASEAQLVEGLNRHSLDVAVAGFTTRSPHGGLVGQTQPYLQARVVIGMRPGATAPASWEGVAISYDARRPDFAGLLLGQGAAPTTGPAEFRLVYEAELAAAGLVPTGTTLRTEQHTIATAPAENALTLALDRFLHANRPLIEARLAREGRP